MPKVDQSKRLRIDLSRETWDRVVYAADRGLGLLDGGQRGRGREALEELAAALDVASGGDGVELAVAIVFDRDITGEQAGEFVGVLAEELEFSDKRDGRFHTSGWGIGRARVIEVAQTGGKESRA
ncbi:MAG TPA: hypothetical protein VII45_09095 [Solirubrobacterales bacterium]